MIFATSILELGETVDYFKLSDSFKDKLLANNSSCKKLNLRSNYRDI